MSISLYKAITKECKKTLLRSPWQPGDTEVKNALGAMEMFCLLLLICSTALDAGQQFCKVFFHWFCFGSRQEMTGRNGGDNN